MILYRDNPRLDQKVVETFDGKIEYRVNCKKIKGEHYIIDLDCIEVDAKWFPKVSNEIFFDHETSQWLMKSPSLKIFKGIVDFDKNGIPVYGLFTHNPYKNVQILSKNFTSVCISQELALQNGCIEDVSTGTYSHKPSKENAMVLIKPKNSMRHENKGYNIEDNEEEMKNKINLYNNFQPSMSKGTRQFGKMLGDTTFGIEIEAIRGYLPDFIQNRTGVVVCRDGSLHDEDGTQGPEFVTVPYQGAKGLQTIYDLCDELKYRTDINEKCSLHIHLGTLPTDRLFLVTMYRLGYLLQDEIFEMFPYYKLDEKKYANKEKNYCNKLNRLSMFKMKNFTKETYLNYVNDNYLRIFTFLSDNVIPSAQTNRKIGIHPKGQKWNRKSRYYWVNLQNMLFSKRNTVEFRIHTATTNPQKLSNWLFICNAIVKTAMSRTSDILAGNKLTLDDVLDYYTNTFKTTNGHLLSQYLKAYVKERKDYFKADFLRGDYLSKDDLDNDKNYEFRFGNIRSLI